MILITGAAGKTGRSVLKALVQRGEDVRGLVRRDQQVEAVKALGAAEVRVGSFDDPNILLHACGGARAVYHVCPNVSPHEEQYARNTIAAAVGSGVTRFVYHSVLHPQIEAMPHHWAKLRVEEMLLASGLDVTILQPTAYMQNILAGWPGIVADGVFWVPYPVETRLSLVDLQDVGAAAARVLTEPGHEGATYELVGTAPLSQIEIAAVLSQTLGRPVGAVAAPVESWDQRVGAARMDEHARATLIKMFCSYGQHGLVGNSNVLRWLLGRAPTTLAMFAARAAAGQA
jgi:NAD(P)H dehydrogenase (quinone)